MIPASESKTAERKKLVGEIATLKKKTDAAKKAAKAAKAGLKQAKQKFKNARRAAKKLRKTTKALEAKLVSIPAKKSPKKLSTRKHSIERAQSVAAPTTTAALPSANEITPNGPAN